LRWRAATITSLVGLRESPRSSRFAGQPEVCSGTGAGFVTPRSCRKLGGAADAWPWICGSSAGETGNACLVSPPWTYPAQARPGSPRQPCLAGSSAPAAMSRLGREVGGWSRQCWKCAHSQRNAVGQVGVKLDAAPDAPPWGQVLVRTPPGCLPSAWRRAISTFICPSREFPVCPALAKDLVDADPCGMTPRPGWPGSRGASRWRWQVATRQRAIGRMCSRDPHPGKDPL
jgi:hypothetical protein